MIPLVSGVVVRNQRQKRDMYTTGGTVSAALLLISLFYNISVLSAASLSGTVHDLSSDPAYLASGGTGLCTQCHVPQANAKPLVENEFKPLQAIR